MELRNDNGRMVRLFRPLTRAGGEGQVFEIEGNSALVAKLYHQPADPQKAIKLRHQVKSAKPALSAIAAWPTDLLLDPANPKLVRGILMPRMAGKEIHKLYGPADRAAEFGTAGWDFLIHVAMNCAAGFETLHEHGAVMADVNEGNLLVKEGDGRVGLIDCDSYQIQNGNGRFLCDVGIPMWTPPELQGRNFRGLERTPNHDRFGLAVVIFRLLFMGRHPFAGIPTGRDQFEIEEAIKRGLFAFTPKTWSRGVKQPPNSLSLGAVPERLSNFFERAFLPGSELPNARPTGREWAQELKALLAALKKGCIDPGHKFWHGLTACPWCEIANTGGPNFFISVSVHLGSANLSADFATFWAAIERVLNGALMREQVAVPSIGRPTPRPMPCVKPQATIASAPVAPTKPVPLPRPMLTAPVLPAAPDKTALKMPVPLPVGPTERMARLGWAGALLFSLGAGLGYFLGIAAVMIGAGWVAACCFVIGVIKGRACRLERRSRIEADRVAWAETRRRTEEAYARTMIEHEEKVRLLLKEHATWVAKAESGYQREWLRQDQEYQRQYNAYLTAMSQHEAAQREYEEKARQWNDECQLRKTNEAQVRRRLNTVVEDLEALLSGYKTQVQSQFPPLEAARKRFEQSKTDEIADMRKLHQKREELQLRQFLASKLIRNADIANIGDSRKSTLAAYGIGSALDLHRGMGVPGVGEVLEGYLMSWRHSCESQFRYTPNTQLPTAEVNAVKVKHAQTRQGALAELRGGAAKLESQESKARSAASQARMEILNLARTHMQAIADLTVCS